MAEKVKIVHIINSFELGGAEKLVLNLCRLLPQEQFEIAICSVIGSGPLINDFEKLGIKVLVFKKKTKIGLAVIWQIYKFLKEYKPQIVHTHLFAADFWGKLAAILARVPVIITTEHSVNLEEGYLKKKVKLLLSYFTAQIIAVSEAVKDHYIQEVKIKANKIKVIHNGVDLQRFAFRGYQPIDLNNTIKAVVVARLEEVKGHRYLIAAMPQIIQKYPNFTLNVVGGGSLGKDLSEQAKQLKIEEKVIFWGMQFKPEEILPQMDLFILPSLWEGLGIVLLEAQAVGLPVLSSSIPGTKEVVIDGQTGLLFAIKSPEAISQCVERLLSNPDLAKKLVDNAHQQVQAKFSLEKMAASYIDLYLSYNK